MLRSFSELIRHIGDVWGQVGINQKIAIALSGVGLVAALLFWSSYAAGPGYVPLYPGKLSVKSAGEVYSALQSKGVPVELGTDGTSVMVPEDRAMKLRLELMTENNLPRGTDGFANIFDDGQSFIGVDENTHRIKLKRAIQGELERTIESLDQVASARVMVVMPKKSWIYDKDNSATASVTITLYSGETLSRSRVNGIARLVAASVESLSPENVTITDNTGMALTRPNDDDQYVYSDKERSKKRELEKNIHRELDPIVGPGKVVASVTVTMDHIRSNTTKKLLTDAATVEREESTDKTVTKAGPSGDPDATTAGSGDRDSHRVIEKETTTTTEYFPMEHIGDTTTIEPGGKIERLTASVMLEAGSWSTDADGNRTYKPADQQTIEDYKKIVKSAIGFDATRDEEANIVLLDKPFWQPEPVADTGVDFVGQLQRDLMPSLTKHGPIVLLLVVFIFFARKAMKNMESVELPLTVGTTVGEAAAMVQGNTSMGPEDGLEQDGLGAEYSTETAAEGPSEEAPSVNPEQAAQALRAWMNE